MVTHELCQATNNDSHGQLASSQDWAGAGTMVAAVSHASGVEPFIVGKPNSTLMDLVTKACGFPPSRCCVVSVPCHARLCF
jgi:phosphoglycolate phosphatase